MGVAIAKQATSDLVETDSIFSLSMFLSSVQLSGRPLLEPYCLIGMVVMAPGIL